MGWEAEHMSMLQIGILGVAGVLLALQFKSGKSEYGIYISIVLGLFDLCHFCLGKISLIKDVLNEINGVAGPGNDYWKTLWKILGITYAAEFFFGQYVKMRGIRRLHYRSKCSPRLRSWC